METIVNLVISVAILLAILVWWLFWKLEQNIVKIPKTPVIKDVKVMVDCYECKCLMYIENAHKRRIKSYTYSFIEIYFCKSHAPKWVYRNDLWTESRYFREVQCDINGDYEGSNPK